MTHVESLLDGPVYAGYAYGYPHKTAYRQFERPLPLAELWAAEPREALSLYIHVPFCEMRCGFCNLFTQAKPKEGVAAEYLAVLARQTREVKVALGGAQFVRFAVGGGTPTALDLAGLDALFALAQEAMGAPLGRIPASIETSPETADADKLALLRRRGVTRVSIGVQSFLEAETAAVGRPQKSAAVRAALERIRAEGFPVLNIDLIYGLPGQTTDSWLGSVREALRYAPEELFLYPLYVRPLTGLGRSGKSWDDLRLSFYREARDLLLSEGYKQASMRMFQSRTAPADDGPAYCCQRDGMVGLGCGARSYTGEVHYSDEYAVRAGGVREILAAYAARSAEAFSAAAFGFRLDDDERRRRYVLLTLLQRDGVPLADYRRRFGGDVFDHRPELADLEAHGLARRGGGRLALTEAGLERSDAIGPWLYSPAVRRRMEGCACR